MVSYGLMVDTINLSQQEIAPHTDAFIIADPKTAFTAQELSRVKAYLNNGGNAIIYAEPSKQSILNPIANELGIHLNNGTILQPAFHFAYDELIVPLKKEILTLSNTSIMQRYARTGKEGGAIHFRGVGDIETLHQNEFNIAPILVEKGTASHWLETGEYRKDSATPVFSAVEGDLQKDQYQVGVKLTRNIQGKEQRIAVIYDADFMSNAALGGSLQLGLHSWVIYNRLPAYTDIDIFDDIYLTINLRTAEIIEIVFTYVIPAIVLLFGMVLLLRRKRK